MPKHRILMVEVVLIYQGNTWLICKNNIVQGKNKGTRFDMSRHRQAHPFLIHHMPRRFGQRT